MTGWEILPWFIMGVVTLAVIGGVVWAARLRRRAVQAWRTMEAEMSNRKARMRAGARTLYTRGRSSFWSTKS